jgi:hypothetical protein
VFFGEGHGTPWEWLQGHAAATRGRCGMVTARRAECAVRMPEPRSAGSAEQRPKGPADHALAGCRRCLCSAAEIGC